jgi:hypothetical protein
MTTKKAIHVSTSILKLSALAKIQEAFAQAVGK